MTVRFVQGSAGYYTLLSTDISSGSWVENAGDNLSYIGTFVVATDTGNQYRVVANHTVAPVAQQISPLPELSLGTSNLSLVLSGSKGSAAIADNSTRISLYTTGSTVRVGFEQPDLTTGSSSGSSAIASDYKKGYLLTAGSQTFFNIGRGVNRTLYFQSGSPTDTIRIIQM